MTTYAVNASQNKWKTRNQLNKCQCGGYWFPHRKGGGACEVSGTRDIHMAIRYGDSVDVMDAQIDRALCQPGRPTTVCPF